MNIYTSYFYKVRFMTPNQLPISTALWDPKWYHNFSDQSYIFLDKRGVLNGLRAPYLSPGPTCNHLCRGREGCLYTHETCEFLKRYRLQLDELPFDRVVESIKRMCCSYKEQFNVPGNVDAILLVHEALTNPCSERVPLQEYFTSHGIRVKEWLV